MHSQATGNTLIRIRDEEWDGDKENDTYTQTHADQAHQQVGLRIRAKGNYDGTANWNAQRNK